MGLLWDLLQQTQISSQNTRTSTIEQRVAHLENELNRTQTQLHRLIQILEKHFGEDIDGDGRVG